jgi:hypothetical protein
VEFEALLERRRRLGQDGFDGVWERVRHVKHARRSRRSAVRH